MAHPPTRTQSVTTDQRGLPLPTASAPDIGAVQTLAALRMATGRPLLPLEMWDSKFSSICSLLRRARSALRKSRTASATGNMAKANWTSWSGSSISNY